VLGFTSNLAAVLRTLMPPARAADTLSRNRGGQSVGTIRGFGIHGYVYHPVGRDAERSELKRAFCSSLSEL